MEKGNNESKGEYIAGLQPGMKVLPFEAAKYMVLYTFFYGILEQICTKTCIGHQDVLEMSKTDIRSQLYNLANNLVKYQLIKSMPTNIISVIISSISV